MTLSWPLVLPYPGSLYWFPLAVRLLPMLMPAQSGKVDQLSKTVRSIHAAD